MSFRQLLDYFFLKSISGLGLSAGGLMTIFAELEPIKFIGAVTALLATASGAYVAYLKAQTERKLAEAEIRKTIADATEKELENEQFKRENLEGPTEWLEPLDETDSPDINDDSDRTDL